MGLHSFLRVFVTSEEFKETALPRPVLDEAKAEPKIAGCLLPLLHGLPGREKVVLAHGCQVLVSKGKARQTKLWEDLLLSSGSATRGLAAL